MVVAIRPLLRAWLLVLVMAMPVTPAKAADPYRIDGILVDVSAADAVTARRDALDQAQRIALDRLVIRLAGGGSAAAAGLEPGLLGELVESVEIEDERVAPTRYIAAVNVRFDGEAVRELLDQRGIARAGEAPAVLVVPALRRDGQLSLWQAEDPWWQAWDRVAAGGALLGYLLPLGDLADRAALPGDGAAAPGRGDPRALLDRYGAADVVLVVAEGRVGDGAASRPAAVTAESLAGGVVAGQSAIRLEPPAPGPVEDGWLLAARALAARLDARWRDARLVDRGPLRSYDLSASFSGLQDWVRMRRDLDGLDGTAGLQVERFAQTGADLTLRYYGDEGRLAGALAQRGYEIENESGRWRLRQSFDLPDGRRF